MMNIIRMAEKKQKMIKNLSLRKYIFLKHTKQKLQSLHAAELYNAWIWVQNPRLITPIRCADKLKMNTTFPVLQLPVVSILNLRCQNTAEAMLVRGDFFFLKKRTI